MSFFFYRQLSYDQQQAWLPSHRIWRSNATSKCVCGEACRNACLHAFRLRSDTRFVTSFATWEIEMVELSPKMRPNREYFWRDRFLNYVIKSVAATSKRSTSYIRERYIVSVSSNFLTQISCGIKTKCRKTRAMQRDFTIVDSLALRQCNTSMIPDTHLLKLLFPTRYTSRSIYLCIRTCKW